MSIETKRVYTVEIIDYPEASLVWKTDDEIASWESDSYVGELHRDNGDVLYGFLDPAWQPDGWTEYAEDNDIRNRHNGAPSAFFWPDTTRIYKSRSSATRRKRLIEQWGATAEIYEADLAWQPIAGADARRQLARVQQRIKDTEGRVENLRIRAAYLKAEAQQ